MQLLRWAFVHTGIISKRISVNNVALNLEI
jgi:hypothetical protein